MKYNNSKKYQIRFKEIFKNLNGILKNTTNQNVWDRVKGDSLDKIHTLLYLHKRTIKNILLRGKKKKVNSYQSL